MLSDLVERFFMEDKDHLRKTLEHYRLQRQQMVEKLRAIEPLIKQLEQDLGEASEDGEDLGIAGVPLPAPPLFIKPDEFYGMNQSDAAKAYLRKVGRAIAFDELVGALKRGGAQLGGADPAKTLYVSLARNPKKEFVWPSRGHIALTEFYENRK